LIFKKYSNIEEYIADVFDILMTDEARNNLLISILIDNKRDTVADWLLSAVTDDAGNILLIALCTPPYNILLCGTGCEIDDSVLELLASELKRINFFPPGIIAESVLARRFSDIYCGVSGSVWKMTMAVMRLDNLSEYKKAPGFCRMLNEDDLAFAPSWEYAFCVDCNLPLYKLTDIEERIKTRIGMNVHYIWDDDKPAAQAVFGRNTPNGAAISWVYTPPENRGKGYATSVVAELCKAILQSGKTFCCLFADVANPASCAVYRKLGFYDVCVVDEIKFNKT